MIQFWKIFQKKTPPKVETEILVEDEETILKRESQREKNNLMREKLRIDIEKMKMDSAKARADLAAQLEEQRDEQYMRKLERKARIRDLEDELFGEDDDEDLPQEASPESMLFSFLNTVMKKQGNASPTRYQFAIDVPSQPAPSPVAVEESQQVTLSQDRINQIWATLPPAHREAAKRLSDDDLRTYLINQMPNIDAESIERAIQTVRNS